MKSLVLSYELAWRTKEDDAFMRSYAWKQIRLRILKRDNYTCAYCGYRSDKGMHVNHINGNPKDNSDNNLEVICPECHMIMHSGLWCAVHKVIKVFKKSKYNQNEIISITRKLRSQGKTDDEIIAYLELSEEAPWKQNLAYLSSLYGFISSAKPPLDSSKPLLTEQEQRASLANRKHW
jgi:rubredoxin